ncbi:MAG TPA: sorbosone dehydrogenase family protein [Candidatus Saccharimonadales bacterium]|nr:sorbosone dehydrogenase family protein [Candidatus Saccharimonadales bacterium]
MHSRRFVFAFLVLIVPGAYFSSPAAARAQAKPEVMTGKAAFSDYTTQRPGVFHKITLADLPAPFESESALNPGKVVPRPPDAWPKALPGFKVDLYASGLDNPRLLRTAPNGDLFVAESSNGEIKIFRGAGKDGKAETTGVFATGLKQPFGIALFPSGDDPQWLYVGNTDSVVRFPYRNGDLKARGPQQVIVADLPGGGRLTGGGHWTRDIAFSRDGKKMYVSVGSRSNNDDMDNNPREERRADILEFNPDGTGQRIYARGIRNAVGIAVHPQTGELWASTNERDGLGDDLPPDYITHVQEGGFYGWPWFYMGGHWDPRHANKHPELKDKVITPDVLLQPHMASLELIFYGGHQFPAEYRGDIFAAEHGSWNRKKRTGYEVVRVPLKNGHATGEYEDFLTGFVTDQGEIWGRPVGVTEGKDGSLFVSDDGSRSIWKVSYTGK